MAETETGFNALEEALAADLDAAFAEQKSAQTEVEEEVEKYVRDETGRFAKKTVEEPAPEQQAAPETPAPNGAEPAAAAAPATRSWKPLWYKEEYGQWDQLSEPFRKALQEQERNAAKAIEERAHVAKAWEPINELVKPFEQQLRMSGQTPQQFIGGLVNIYNELQQDPVKALNWLTEQTLGAGWNIGTLAQWMQEQNYQPQRADPVVQELQQLKQQLAELREAPVRQQRDAMREEIAAWAQDKPHFNDLRGYMADLAKKPEFKGASLDKLYEEAHYAHPVFRERILADKRAAEVAEARRRGAQSPRGTPVEGASPRKQQGKRQSVEDAVKEAFDEAGI